MRERERARGVGSFFPAGRSSSCSLGWPAGRQILGPLAAQMYVELARPRPTAAGSPATTAARSISTQSEKPAHK